MNEFKHRISELQRLMTTQGYDLAIVSWTDQMRYLTGYAENGHKRLLVLLVPVTGDPVFVVPSLNEQAARANRADIERVIPWQDSDGWSTAILDLAHEMRLPERAKVLVDDELHSVHLIAFMNVLPGIQVFPADEAISILRRIKTAAELEWMQRAADDIDAVADEVMGALVPGITEKAVQQMVVDELAARGAEPGFTPLVCFGANGAMPHHDSNNTALQVGDVVVLDIGSTFNGYHSDITRTFAFGAPACPEAVAVYDSVLRANHAARALAAPGVSCEAVDDAARRVITHDGFGDFFIHRTGHGIGLSGHEPPYIVKGNSLALAPGMCFSVEPGIYLPSRFGVRIEVIVTVTENGVKSLNVEPSPELVILR